MSYASDLGLTVGSKIRIKFPCCVPMSEIKDQETFDKIFALFIANGAGEYETDWEDNKDYGYNYFGVDYDKDTVFYGCVESYSFNDEEDEVTAYSVAELLGSVPKEEAPVTPVVTEVPVIALLPVGTEVQIAKDSEWYYGDEFSSNPKDVKGTIASNTHSHDTDGFVYYVKWSNGSTNSYKLTDLVLWNEATEAPPQEAITERLEDNPSAGIDLSKEASSSTTEPLVSIVKDVTYHVSIKGTLFTFTQDEINEITEELLGFSDDF